MLPKTKSDRLKNIIAALISVLLTLAFMRIIELITIKG